jgi:outer membrane protein TolC
MAVVIALLVASRDARAQEPVETPPDSALPAADTTAGTDSTNPAAGAPDARARVLPPLDPRIAGAPEITLEEAVRRAVAVSPAVARDEGDVVAARAAERSAFGAFLPNLFFDSGATLASTQRINTVTNTTESGSSTSYAAGLSSSVDLFSGGRRTAQVRGARAERATIEASLVSDRFAVVLAAKQAFFDALRAVALEAVAGQRVTRAEEGLSAAANRLAVGSATLSDSLRAQFELTDARVALLQARSDLTTTTYALGRVVGMDGPASPVLPETLEPVPLPLAESEIVELAVAAAPSVREAEARLRSGQAGVDVARSQYFPTLRLGGGYNWLNQDFSVDGGNTSWRGVLELSYPLFDNFQREEDVARARAEVQGASAEVPDARRAARAEAERLLSTLRLTEQQIELARENVHVADEDLRVQSERYALGSTTSLDRITSQVSVAQAQADLVAAYYEYQVARAQLEALLGREL